MSQTNRRRLRLVLLLLAGLLLVAGALGYRHFYLSRPVGTGPAGPAVPREPFARVWTGRRVLLLGVGDSVTEGYGATEGFYYDDLPYFERLVCNPRGEFPDMEGICLAPVLPRLEARNLAVADTTSPEHVDMLARIEKQPAEVLGLVAITTGTSDVMHDYGRSPPREGAMYGATLEQARPWIASFERRLGQIVGLLEARFPGGCHVFLADICDPTDGAGDFQNAGLPAWPDGLAVHGAYNRAIRRCAAERPNVHLVPVHREFLGHGIRCRRPWCRHYRRDDPCFWYYGNLEDPNDRGHDAIRRLFLIEMARVAGEFKGKKEVREDSRAPLDSAPPGAR
jgi:hypothetical protein